MPPPAPRSSPGHAMSLPSSKTCSSSLLPQDKGNSFTQSLGNPCHASPPPPFIPSGNQSVSLADFLLSPEHANPWLLCGFAPAACSPGRPVPSALLVHSSFPRRRLFPPPWLFLSTARLGTFGSFVLQVPQPRGRLSPGLSSSFTLPRGVGGVGSLPPGPRSPALPKPSLALGRPL